MKNLTNFTIAGLVAFSLLVSPSLSLADTNSGSDKQRHQARAEAKLKLNANGADCLKAFGHLIAPGFLKKNGELTVKEECRMPFGISRKLSGSGTTTPDSSEPIILGLRVNAEDDEAVIVWRTNERADSAVFFGTSTPVAISGNAAVSVQNSANVLSHKIELDGLSADTTYFIVVRSEDASGNVAFSGTISFKTESKDDDDDKPRISDIATVTSTSTIAVSFKTEEEAKATVYYGTSPIVNLGTSAKVEHTGLVKAHNFTLTGLSANTTYFLLIQAEDADGDRSFSSRFTAKTAAQADVTAPVISNILGTVGTGFLSVGYVTNEPATSKVYYSTTSPATTASASVENNSLVHIHSLPIPSLSSGTAYHLMIESKDASGNVNQSGQFTLTTL